jgi:prepilin-type N-terminal cleavage/methylation domain-containing protein
MKPVSKAFSLIEILVTIVISGIVLSGVLGSYFSLVQASQKADTARQLQKEVNFAMIRMADKIRSYSINYSVYEDQDISKDGSRFLFTEGNEGATHKFQIENSDGKQILTMDGAPLFSSFFEVKDFHVSITPNNDPFDSANLGDSEAQFQPKATIFLSVEARRYPDVSLVIQTTISSRRYE